MKTSTSLLTAGIALFGAACSGTETTSSVVDGAVDAPSMSIDGPISDSTSTFDGSSAHVESGSCGLLPTGPDTCNAILQQSTTVTSSCSPDPLPAAQGGLVDDGTYVLQSITYYAGACPASPDVERITWAVCGTQWELVEDLPSRDGGIDIVRLNLNRPAQGNMISSNITCKPGTPQPVMAPAQAYTATPGRFVVQVQAASGLRVDTFTKR